ncbi:mandelate racemase/muconate lactonizing enzyme family protein [Bremerella sp. P1]|uniref:mandelate racemase/muconate lactonizing enzyme family protein n=1 Tax=Bremerella sp. P1 TaxID=3026424 RepID=UPI002367668B|nr:mandelate racemase/muconate lactonizing enzyme family protein [Bremerella sp. P1]WDI42404.1 mandelate racemase/muconate lactonizing enzyme family protein [Bremerella sp. P1]
MTKPTDIVVRDVKPSTETIQYRTPMKFGGRVVTDVTLFNVEITVETKSGKIGQGFGSMPMGNVWGWPSQQVEGSQTLAAMIEVAERFSAEAGKLNEAAHPLQHARSLHEPLMGIGKQLETEFSLPEAIPPLALLVAGSPIDAAIHDAYGKALGLNSYNTLGKEFIEEDLSGFLNEDFAGEYLDQYTTREPQPTMPLYHLVGALDPLDHDELTQPVGDGLPETLAQWIVADGLTHLKIKLNGDDIDWDVARVAKIDKVATAAQSQRGVTSWFYSLDFNEKCASVQYVLDFLAKLAEVSPSAMDRVQYIEQPTHRDLRKHPENKMHAAAKIKPVVIDESLIDLDTLFLSREQGYSGVALKACKGHSEALLMGAAAQKYKLFLCVQDLTCPGASFLHSASIAARLPTIAAIEGNGRQYCPAGNDGWRDRFPAMFNITDGTVGTGVLTGPGLGF